MIERIRRVGLGLLAGCLVAGGTALFAAEPLRLYVSNQGKDVWSGRLEAPNAASTDGPFATLEHARDAARLLRKTPDVQAGITVLVRGGAYELAKTLTFSAQDGGTTTAPIVYRAYPNEQAFIRGGRSIAGFQPYKGEILKADLAARGLKDADFHELFYAQAAAASTLSELRTHQSLRWRLGACRW